jgi:hypothetical protein
MKKLILQQTEKNAGGQGGSRSPPRKRGRCKGEASSFCVRFGISKRVRPSQNTSIHELGISKTCRVENGPRLDFAQTGLAGIDVEHPEDAGADNSGEGCLATGRVDSGDLSEKPGWKLARQGFAGVQRLLVSQRDPCPVSSCSVLPITSV